MRNTALTSEVLILGAGVGGLTLALKLTQQNQRVLILEKDAIAPDAGAGLLLAPNATRILDKLSILNDAIELGRVTNQWSLLDQSGALLRDLRVDTGGYSALSICRADLLQLLKSRIPHGSLRTNVAVSDIEGSESGVRVTLADNASVHGKALIGADGLRSYVRHKYFQSQPLQYRGYVGWRGIANFVPDGYSNGRLSETWGMGGRFGIAPVDKARTYWYASANQSEDWIDPAPFRRASLLERFMRWHKPVTDLIAATPNDQILVSRIYDVPPMNSWCKGNVALLGDAAHGMTPNLGQGACQAIEDAWKLGVILSPERSVAGALREYQNERMVRVRSIQLQSRAMGCVVQLENPVVLSVRNWLTRRILAGLIQTGMQGIFADIDN